MTTPEYIIIGFIILGALVGYKKGFLKQISWLLGLLIGYFAAVLFVPEVHIFLVKNEILSPTSSLWISFFLTILLAALSVKLLSSFIERGLKATGLNFTNRFAGIIFGAFTYGTIIFFITLFLYKLGFINSENISQNTIDFLNLLNYIIFK